jgi:hypothetical protein
MRLAEQLDQILSSAEDDERIHVVVNNFKHSLEVVRSNYNALMESMRCRQCLIDLQCEFETFTGAVHDEYHEASSQVEIDLDNYYSSVRTCLNHLAVLAETVAPHELRRGLRSKSFSSFTESLDKVGDTVAGRLALGHLLDNRDLRTLKEMVTYRDKAIEHVRDVERVGVGNQGSSMRMITKKTVKKRRRKLEKKGRPHGEINGVMYCENLKDGSKVRHVHITPDPHTWRQPRIEKGDVLGYRSDGGSGHFAKFESHEHIFTSSCNPDEDALPHVQASQGPVDVSPDPLGGVEALLRFSGALLNSVAGNREHDV